MLHREDMISILGKRPFPERADEMDKWLDAQREKKQRSPTPEPTPSGVEIPVPVLFRKLD
jgi:AFG3 family protein